LLWCYAFYQYRQGLLDADEWNGYRQLIPFLVGSNSPSLESWKVAAAAFSPVFIREVEQVLLQDQGQSKALI
jgi:hypothetical protein